MNSFYITTPIYYANSLPHLGHLYTTIVADVVQRYKKQRGFDTYFLTGTDEHGVNIQRAAANNNRSNQEQVDYISGELKRMFHDFRLDKAHGGYDIFMRTTKAFHYHGATKMWLDIQSNKTPKGNETIYKGFYEGWFCAPCAEFKTEDEYYLEEGNETPFCKIHERSLDKVSEESYFFRLSDYQEELLKLIEENPSLVRPDARRNEVLSFIRGGLQDLSISREKSSVSWGIPVPGDENHVMYVWMDALSNYITALGYGNTERDGFDKYWQNVTHLVGKDILRFHTVYWFTFLIAAGLELPKGVYAHGMWLDANGRKMGKTLGNVIEVDVLHRHFQVEAIRYFLMREMVFGQDGKFGYENLIERANADLANGLGNLASRTFSMINKYREGLVPSGQIAEENYIFAKRAGINPDEQELVSVLVHARDEFIRRFDNFEFSQGLETIWALIARIDLMISESKPWTLIKDEQQQETLNAVLYRATETLRWLSVILQPVMPEAAAKIYAQIGLEGSPADNDPATLVWGGLAAGTKLGETEGVFPRIDKNKVMSEIEAGNTEDAVKNTEDKIQKTEGETQETEEELEEKTFITIDDFIKVELRVGQVLEAERVPKSDKLLRFMVDVGEESPRQILAGIAEHYEPESLIGKKIVVVANLAPRKLRGFESQGMVCAASVGDGDKPVLATFSEDVPNGARLK